MNGYTKIMLISAIIVIISIVIEFKDPLYPLKKDATSNIKRLFWRWRHWCVIIFNCFFFLFFDIKKYNHNIAIYYSLMTVTVLHWYSSICMISFLETKNYNININKLSTSNLPHISVIFGDNSRLVANSLYFIGALNFSYITFFTKKINYWFKLTFFALFAVSYFKNIILFGLQKKSEKYGNGLLQDCLMANHYI